MFAQAVLSTIRMGGLRDPVLPWVIAAAGIVAVLSWLYFFSQDTTLAYYDAQARLLITRRVLDSPTPGLAQLGAVWLPLTHVLALPLIGIDRLYQTGLALSLVSMASFVVLIYTTYQTVYWLTKERTCALIAALIVMSNPNMIYMTATPMTEVPMFATMMLSVYALLRLSHEPENRRWLFLSGFAIALSTLVRYEAWLLLLAQAALLLYVFLRKRLNYAKIEGLSIFWGYWAFIGIVGWLVWNWMIFGDPLAFQRGEYARPSLWVVENDPIIGNWGASFWSYMHATLATVGPLFFVGIAGAVVYALQTRLRADRVMPLALFALFPAFVLMVYAGQRPLKVPEVSNDMYNIRFALVMLLPVSIFVAYLARRFWTSKLLIVLIVVICAVAGLRQYGVITIAEPTSVLDTPRARHIRETSAWLQSVYDGGPMLMESYGNDTLQFVSGIDLGGIIYEGSYQLWEPALEQPQRHVDWVVMRLPPSDAFDLVGADKVWGRWGNDPALERHFTLVYENAMYRVYQRTTQLSR